METSSSNSTVNTSYEWFMIPSSATMLVMTFPLAIMILFGTFGNVWVVVTVCRHKRFHTPPYLLLANLSVVDAAFSSVLCTGSFLVNMLHTYLFGRPAAFYYDNCFILGCITEFIGLLEPLSMVAIAINRYIMVAYPHAYKGLYTGRRTALSLVVMSVVCVVCSLPAAGFLQDTTMGYLAPIFLCTVVSRSVTLFFYWNIACLFITIICTVFILSYGFYVTVYIISMVTGLFLEELFYIIIFFFSFNAAVNPLIYLIFNKDFSRYMRCSGAEVGHTGSRTVGNSFAITNPVIPLSAN